MLVIVCVRKVGNYFVNSAKICVITLELIFLHSLSGCLSLHIYMVEKHRKTTH